jgi:hypothetical protein
MFPEVTAVLLALEVATASKGETVSRPENSAMAIELPPVVSVLNVMVSAPPEYESSVAQVPVSGGSC